MRSCTVMMLGLNGAEHLCRFLRAVVDAADGIASVCVVDNNSAEGGREVCAGFPRVRFDEIGENRSLLRTRFAAARCDSNLFVTLDADVLFDAAFLPPLLERFNSEDDALFA